MRLTRRSAIGIAVVCGGLAAVLSLVLLKSATQPQVAKQKVIPEVEVVVPRFDIPVHTKITADLLTRKTIRASDVSKTAVKSAEEIIGYVAVRPLVAGRQIERSSVKPPEEALGLAGIIPPGMRAVTVAVDPVMGVANLLKTGDRVDVIATFQVGDNVVAVTVLQDVLLLALGKQTFGTEPTEEAGAGETAAEGQAEAEPKAEAAKKTTTKAGETGTKAQRATAGRTTQRQQREAEYPNATLAVTPADAQKLMLADQRGDLRLALRPVNEHDFVPLESHDLAAVVGPRYARLMSKSLAEAEEKKVEEATSRTPAPQAPATAPAPPWAAWGAAPAPPQVQPAKPSQPAKKPAPKPPDEVLVIKGDQATKVIP